MKDLNFVFLTGVSFPRGYAFTKRRKYVIDYLNEQNISSSVIQSRSEKDDFNNPTNGMYGICNYSNTSYLWHQGILGKLKFVKEIFRFLNKHFDKDKLNVIVFTTILLEDIPFYLFAKLRGYKVFFETVENNTAIGTRISSYGKISTKLTRYLFKSAKGIFVISSKLKQLVNNIAPGVPVCILPNSAPLMVKYLRKKFNTPLRILYSGTFAQKDGLEFFIKGYLRFQNNTTIATELILTGDGNKKDMESVFLLINNSPNIKYMGFLSDEEFKDMIGNSDILTMTRCNSEFANYGFPFKLSEYLASGNTVLATKVGDVPNYLKHKENAYLIEPENIQDVADALNFLTLNEQEAIKIGMNGLSVVEKYFNVEKNGKLFVDFAQECLNKKKVK